MSNFWSSKVQSTELLQFSRIERFNEQTKAQWFKHFNIKPDMKILEVGCGGGHFASMIKKNFPSCEVYGIDLDEAHIKYAKEHYKEVNFLVADINSLPFEDNTFDIIYSHTVIEHLPFKNFITEQHRVLKENGKLIIFEVEPKMQHTNNFTYLLEEIDQQFSYLEFEKTENKVGAYGVEPNITLKNLENYGFKNIHLSFEEIMYYFPDNEEDTNIALNQIKSAEKTELAHFVFSIILAKNGDKFKDIIESLIKEKYKKRIELLNSNTKVYDYKTTAIRVFTAKK